MKTHFELKMACKFRKPKFYSVHLQNNDTNRPSKFKDNQQLPAKNIEYY